MTPEELIARVRELSATATRGPWYKSPHTFGDPGDGPTCYRISSEFKPVMFIHEYSRVAERDAALVAEYRTLAPKLADMLERAIEGMQQMQLSSTIDELFDTPGAVLQDIEAMA